MYGELDEFLQTQYTKNQHSGNPSLANMQSLSLH